VAKQVVTEVDGRQLKLTNLDKVLYPETGTTKADVISYYHRIAPVLIDHAGGRCVTFRRYPDGVDGESFFEKRCPSHRPEWVETAVGPGDRRGEVRYCRLDEPAAVVWAANLAALELHTPMARSDDLDNPLMAVFDLDPGPGTGIPECAELALELRDVCAAVDLEMFAKTSGSKGMQVYVPLNSRHSHEHASDFAKAAGGLLEQRHPKGVTITMARDQRPGKVFVDWSQNSRHKTTICPYSLRARPEPTVSTPVSWDEVAEAAEGAELRFTAEEVLDRVEEMGDLFAPTLTLVQHLPGA
jgi:bifunctional non-homologous end joining protein LigD